MNAEAKVVTWCVKCSVRSLIVCLTSREETKYLGIFAQSPSRWPIRFSFVNTMENKIPGTMIFLWTSHCEHEWEEAWQNCILGFANFDDYIRSGNCVLQATSDVEINFIDCWDSLFGGLALSTNPRSCRIFFRSPHFRLLRVQLSQRSIKLSTQVFGGNVAEKFLKCTFSLSSGVWFRWN